MKSHKNRGSSRNSFLSSPVPSWRDPPPVNQSPVAPPPASVTPSLRTDIRHVRKLGGTHKYLKELLEELDSSGKKYRALASVARDSLRFLGSRDRYWKQQMPNHVVSRLEKEEELRDTPRSTKQAPSLINHIIKELKRINKDFQEGRYEDCVTMSNKCLKALDLYSEDEIQNKREIQGKIHSFIGSSYLELGFLDEALSNHQMDLEIAREIKSQKAESRALDNLGRVYSCMDRKQEAIDVWESKIPLCTETSERCWLFHELGYLHLDVNKPVKAAEYGELAHEEAVKEGTVHGRLTAITLIGQSHAVMGNLEKAHDLFTKALELANQINDANASDAIIQRLDELNREMAVSNKHDTPDQEKTTPTTTPNQQMTTPSQQHTTAKQHKTTPNQQKTAYNQQKTTPSQQKTTTNHQNHTHQQDNTSKNNSPRVNGSQSSLKLPSIYAKHENQSSNHEQSTKHPPKTQSEDKDAKHRRTKSQKNKPENAAIQNSDKNKIDNGSGKANTDDLKTTPGNSADKSTISNKTSKSASTKPNAQNASNEHHDAKKTDESAAHKPISSIMKPFQPSDQSTKDETNLHNSSGNGRPISKPSNQSVNNMDVPSSPQIPSGSVTSLPKPSNPNQRPKVRFQTPTTTKKQNTDPESIQEEIPDESHALDVDETQNLDGDESGSVNNLRRIQQKETPRGKNRMQRPAMHDNRLEILPPSFSSASMAENV